MLFRSSVSIEDSATGQFLINRLTPVMRDFMTTKAWSFSNTAIDEDAEVKLIVRPRDEHSVFVSVENGRSKFSDILDSPYKTMPMRERRAQYFAEMAMIFWLRHL